jgi:hypothetical protein
MKMIRVTSIALALSATLLFSCTTQSETVIPSSDTPTDPVSATQVPAPAEDHPCRVIVSSESGNDGGDLIDPMILLVRMSLEGELTEIGTVSVSLRQVKEEPYFLNILADLDRNGIWDTTSTSDDMMREWIVNDTPILITESNLAAYFSIDDPELTDNQQVNVRVIVSEEPQLPIGEWNCEMIPGSLALDTTVQIKIFDTQRLADPAEGYYGAGVCTTSSEVSKSAILDPHAEDLNLESIFYRPGVPDVDQGQNTCVGHSMANSLAWLAQEHGFTDKFQQPKDAQGNDLETYDVTTAEGVNDMAWEMIGDWEDKGKYTPQDGVSSDAIVSGKQDFVNKRGLPVTVEQIGDESGETTLEAVQEALKEGCDVELGLKIDTEAGPKAHMVTVVGFSDVMIGDSPYRGLTFHDPLTPSDASGPGGGNDLYEYDPKTHSISNFPFLGKLRKAKLAFAVKECYTPPKVSSSGIYRVGIEVAMDSSGHRGFVLMPSALDLTVRQSDITFEGQHPWIQVIGNLDEEGNFEAAGRGTVAGYANIAVTFQGTIFDGQLAGDYTMGAQGGLPGGGAIVYRVEGQRTSLLEEPVAGDVPNAVDEFFETFNAHFRAQSSQRLIELLHPAVLELYGVEACQVYLAQVIQSVVQVEVLKVSGPEVWQWEIDDRSTAIEGMYTVLARVSAGDSSSERDLHIAQRPDGTLGWFTDCGDPLP